MRGDRHGLWITYGFLIRGWPVVGSNLVCLLQSAAILGLKWRFSTLAIGGRGP